MRLMMLLLPSLAWASVSLADVSTAQDLRGDESFSEAPMKKGWFQLPGGYELTFIEHHSAKSDPFIMRKEGVRARFDSRELRPDECVVDRLNAVRIGSRGSLEAEAICEFHGDKQSVRTTLARLVARYDEGRNDLHAAIAHDPSLASARVALARSQDREDAVATILDALTIPSFYLEALEDRRVAPLLDDPRVQAKLPRDGTAKVGEVAWSSRLQRIAWFQEFDTAVEDEFPFRLVIQTLGGYVDRTDWGDAKVEQRYLHDMGFKAARALKNTPGCREEAEKTNVRAWQRAMRALAAPALRVEGDDLRVSVGGKTIFKIGRCEEDTVSWTAGYLPEPNALYEITFPRGPCTVGGAPAARAWIKFHAL
jgi:hypothetical protein